MFMPAGKQARGPMSAGIFLWKSGSARTPRRTSGWKLSFVDKLFGALLKIPDFVEEALVVDMLDLAFLSQDRSAGKKKE